MNEFDKRKFLLIFFVIIGLLNLLFNHRCRTVNNICYACHVTKCKDNVRYVLLLSESKQVSERNHHFQTSDINIFIANVINNNTLALVRERTIPTERPPPVHEVSANFADRENVAWSV
jgi:hypothetical protein